MKDCLGREIKIGDEVAFSVGTAIKTGKVVTIKESRRYNHMRETAKIALTRPEARYGNRTYLKNEDGSYQTNENGSLIWADVVKPPLMFRSCDDTTRIILVNRALDSDVK